MRKMMTEKQLQYAQVILYRALGHINDRRSQIGANDGLLESKWPMTMRELVETYAIINYCTTLLRYEL